MLLWLLTSTDAGCSSDTKIASGPESVGTAESAGVLGSLGAGQSGTPALTGAAGVAAVGGGGPGFISAGASGAAPIGGTSALGGSGGKSGSGGASGAGAGGVANAGGAGGMQSTAGISGSGAASGSGGAASGSGGAGGQNSVAPGGVGAVGQHGALHVKGNRVVDASGQPLQLRGMSLFWSQWSNFYSAGTVDQLVDDWHATVVRAALGVENDGGYLASPTDNEMKVVSVVDHAIQRGLYVIIDWHDSNAQTHQSSAIDFFTRMAKKYGSSPGVVFEIYNEPTMVDWPTVKTYAQAVIAAIRGAGATNLVIVGTPNWSQDVDVAAGSPLTGYTDVAYTLHFYAATHKQPLRDKAQKALDAGLALFVTEWGTCESTGDGMLDPSETKLWLDFLNQNQISWANWSLNDKAESCSALTPTAGTKGPWSGSALTMSGMLVKPLIP
ncbi:MAG TPA: glycoside hydrolase family 5 protein [Polyangiales bacterium]|jgi:endoglucanase